ncbi:MAG: hypothetical protein HY901_34465 [Deltaproteobacteria bacterium]|nr:hypothetical protein [Deltaproteobacteria bacterium]
MTTQGFVPPIPEAVASLIGQLVGRKITSKDAKPLVLGTTARGYVGIYRNDQGALAAVAVMDLPLAANAAAALVLLPPGVVSESVRAGQLSANLAENLHEVMNVLTRFFNVPGNPHVKLQEIVPCPPNLPADVAALIAKPNAAANAELAITGYGSGRVSLYG